MERDLSKIRKNRAERDRRPSPRISSSPAKPLQAIDKEEDEIVAEIQSPAQEILQNLEQDTVIPDAPIHIGELSSDAIQTSELAKRDDKEQAITSLEGMPQDSQNTAGLAISIPENPKSASKPDEILATLPQPSDAAKNGEDFDFDSMFSDTGMVAEGATIDFDMDFSTEGNSTQNILSETGMEGISMNNAELANAMPATNDDLNSLLPGLENYVNATNDPNATNPVGNGTATLENIQIPENADLVSTTLPPTTDPAAADSNFDDFFNAADFNTTEANGNSEEFQIGDGNFDGFGEFDDNWF